MMDILDKIRQEKNNDDIIGDLSNYLAYQFNNILQVIKGNVELVLLSLDSSDVNFKRLEDVYKATQEGGFLTKRLIALNKSTFILDQEEIKNNTDDMSKYVKEGKERILVIDDNKEIVEMMKQMLIKFQYEVLLGNNAEDCLKILKENTNTDMVILDFNLPDMNGIELTKKISKDYPKVKTILTSGYSLNTHFREIYDAGACGFLNKPFKLKELLRIIRRNLDGCTKVTDEK
jgi:CheY-like chemotaxis protein